MDPMILSNEYPFSMNIINEMLLKQKFINGMLLKHKFIPSPYFQHWSEGGVSLPHGTGLRGSLIRERSAKRGSEDESASGARSAGARTTTRRR